MRMGRAIALAMLIAVMGPGPVLAQSAGLSVVGGDHPGFTRLVITFGGPPDWALGQADGALTLRVAGTPPRYALAGALDTVLSTRIAGLTQDAVTGDLAIELSCDCGVQAYLLDARHLVIDVHAQAGAGDPRFARALPPRVPAPKTARRPVALETEPVVMATAPSPIAGTHLSDDVQIILPGTGPVPEGALVVENPRLAQGQLPPADQIAPSGALPLLPAPEALEARRAVTEALANEISRAAALGLLDPTRETPPSTPDTRPDADAADARPVPPPNIRFETGVDPATGALSLPPDLGRNVCPRRSAFDIAVWGGAGKDEPGALGGLAAARVALFDTLGAPKPRAVTALAKNHIHLTFGAEAVAILTALAPPGPETERLLAMARLIDDPAAGPRVGLEAPSNCGAAPALWALLAGTKAGDLAADLNPVLLYFSGLPRHLRQHLGPHVVARLLDLGARDAALTARNAIPRLAAGSSPALELIDGRLAALGLQVSTKPDLPALARSTTPEAAFALIALIDQAVDEGAPLSAADVASAGAMAFERAGTTDAAPLKAAEIRGRVARGEFVMALQTLRKAEAEDVMAPPTTETLRARVYRAAAAQAPDAVFARLLFDPDERAAIAAAPRAVRVAIADRLVAMRFAERAAELVRTLPTPADADARRLRARVALARGRPEEAAAAVSPPITPEEAQIASAADLATGRFDDARARCASFNDAACATQAALRARDWAALSDAAPDPVRNAAALTQTPAPVVEGPPTLAEGQSAIDRARAARAQLQDLLAAIPPADRNGS